MRDTDEKRQNLFFDEWETRGVKINKLTTHARHTKKAAPEQDGTASIKTRNI